ncbi:MAG: patatin family protein [Lachnospiraceae bacterium]|nr:patatin family protein [Lachnospiraceae bacterium]
MVQGALILEGGALRGMFTAGVLDVFLEKEIEFSYVNGVSAGSLNGMNYISKQNGRSRDVNLQFVNDKRYMSARNIVRNGGIFNFRFLFGEISEQLLPFDARAFFASEQRFEVVATNCRTGRAEYFEKGKEAEILRAAAASSSMPILSSMIVLNGRRYLDGGVSEPIAYRRAMEQGYDKIVLVLTRQKGFRKPAVSRSLALAYRRHYRRYPQLVGRLLQMPEHYNRMQEELERLEAAGRVFIIRPPKPVLISRTEKDTRRLRELYEEGRREAAVRLPAMEEYLHR